MCFHVGGKPMLHRFVVFDGLRRLSRSFALDLVLGLGGTTSYVLGLRQLAPRSLR